MIIFIFFILFSVELFAADSNDKQLKSFTEIKKFGAHLYQKNPESLIANAYRNYCHSQNIHKAWGHRKPFDLNNFDEEIFKSMLRSKLHVYEKFKVFDDRKDSNHNYECKCTSLREDAIIRHKLIFLHGNHNISIRKSGSCLVSYIFFDKNGQPFCLQGIKKENSNNSIIKPIQIDKHGNSIKDNLGKLIIVPLKKRDKDGNALKNSDGTYIFEE